MSIAIKQTQFKQAPEIIQEYDPFHFHPHKILKASISQGAPNRGYSQPHNITWFIISLCI